MRVLGLDIGGANIKASTADGISVSVPFALWRNRDSLPGLLQDLSVLKEYTPDLVALTMTAELADCFATKEDGVQFIVQTVMNVFPLALVRVWLTSGEFAEPLDAMEIPMLAAASNWHALATWAGRAVPSGPALLVDVGSTTTDIIPIFDGIPVPEGRTDLERLAVSELRYTGVRRTPICAIVQSVPLAADSEGRFEESCLVPIAAELFATSLDIHLLNGDLPADDKDLDTADGRPATRPAAMNRLAHMLCCDSTELAEAQILQMAAYVAEQQMKQIVTAISNRSEYLSGFQAGTKDGTIQVLLSGSGAWLAERAIQEFGDSETTAVSSLSEMFVRNVSGCAPAFAVARLAAERCVDDMLPTVPF